MKLKELKQIASDIIEANDGCLISGSLGLNILGVTTRREPQDIDIYLPYGQKFNPIGGMKPHHYETQDDYDNIYYIRKAFKLGEVKIDVFTPEVKYAECGLPDDEDNSVLAKHVIIGFKIQHRLGESYSKWKHGQDILHILANN